MHATDLSSSGVHRHSQPSRVRGVVRAQPARGHSAAVGLRFDTDEVHQYSELKLTKLRLIPDRIDGKIMLGKVRAIGHTVQQPSLRFRHKPGPDRTRVKVRVAAVVRRRGRPAGDMRCVFCCLRSSMRLTLWSAPEYGTKHFSLVGPSKPFPAPTATTIRSVSISMRALCTCTRPTGYTS